MSEAKTVELAIREVGESYRERGRVEVWEAIEGCIQQLQRYVPYLAVAHFIPGADAVVTEEGSEAAARVYCRADAEETHISFGLLWREDKPRYLEVARVALEAAGIVCATESSTIVSDRVVLELTRVVPDDGGTTCTELRKGDRIYIVRANPSAPADNDRGTVTGRDTSTASTLGTDVSKDGPGIDKGG